MEAAKDREIDQFSFRKAYCIVHSRNPSRIHGCNCKILDIDLLKLESIVLRDMLLRPGSVTQSCQSTARERMCVARKHTI